MCIGPGTPSLAEVDPDLPPVELALGLTAPGLTDRLRHLRHTLDLDPSYAEAYHQAGDLLMQLSFNRTGDAAPVMAAKQEIALAFGRVRDSVAVISPGSTCPGRRSPQASNLPPIAWALVPRQRLLRGVSVQCLHTKRLRVHEHQPRRTRRTRRTLFSKCIGAG